MTFFFATFNDAFICSRLAFPFFVVGVPTHIKITFEKSKALLKKLVKNIFFFNLFF